MRATTMGVEKKADNETWESFADRRIREAEEAGEFRNLPGLGKPIPGLDEPLDENWWVRQKLAREQVDALPPILRARRDVERTLERLDAIPDETVVRRELVALNERVEQAHFSHQSGPADGVRRIDVEREVRAWAKRRDSA